MANRNSRIVVPVYAPSYDGRYWGRYPNGDKPNLSPFIEADAQGQAAASAALSTAIRVLGSAKDVASASAGISTGIKLSGHAVDVASASAILPSANVLSVGSGKQFSTISSAMTAVQPGQIIELYNGTYNEPIVTQRAGTATKSITIRAASGQSPVVIGFINITGQQAIAHILHSYWDAGQGIELRGNHDGSSNSFDTATPTTAVHIADGVVNLVERFKATGTRVEFVRMGSTNLANNRLVRPRFTGKDCRICGTLLVNGSNPISDSGEGISFTESNGCDFPLMDNCYMQMGGGHSSSRFSGNNGLVMGCLFDQDWSSVFGAGKGQKTLTTSLRTRGVVEDCMMRNSGRQLDSNPTTSMTRNWSDNTLYRRLFLIHAMDVGVSAFSCDNSEVPGGNNLRYAHCTVHDFTASAVDIHGEGTGKFGPFYFKNCLFSSCVQGPTFPSSTNQYVITLRYKSSVAPDWKTLLFVNNCAFDSNYNIRILDLDGVVGTITRSVTQAQIDFPNNFSGNIIASPNFVSTTKPTTTDPATAIAQCRANFVPQNSSIVGHAAPLTVTSGTVNNSSTVTVADANWFRDAMGWSHLTGDTIFFSGVGSRVITGISGNVITLNAPITVGSGAGVYLGSSGSPNIGAVL